MQIKKFFSAKTAALCLTVALPGIAHAQNNEVIKLIESYGFEYRANQETPWGMRIAKPEQLTWIKVNNDAYKIDPSQGLTRSQMREFMQEHINKFGRKEVELFARVLLNTPLEYTASLADASPMEQKSVIYGPQQHVYRAYLPSFEIRGKSFDVYCDFKFIEQQNKYFLLYARRGPYQEYDSDAEPHCYF